eukprot:TRINITY_DN6768_c0_g1_i1.p1 TRINITY_DN6768_c0_g1~~TRINITY_DN6768_c0_g1_i1.p1  ORF type:complete len:469 (-),score=71.82 TRINITY_DN6768_c0_g1_i1:642-2048(-)
MLQPQICRNLLRMQKYYPSVRNNIKFYSIVAANKSGSDRHFCSNFSTNVNQHRISNKSIVFPKKLLGSSEFRLQNILERGLSISAARLQDAAKEAGSASTDAANAVPSPPTDSITAVAADSGAAATDSSKELIIDFLPEKPAPLDPATLLGEPTFESLGLGSWWPPGRLQLVMEFLHVNLGLDWWQVIPLMALTLRLFTFPLNVMSQRNVAHMHNHAKEMQRFQEAMTDARKRGDKLEQMQAAQDLQEWMKKKGINPFKNVLPGMMQIPIFISMFFGLRGMANLPVPSLEEGGALWFENLTMIDPFYALPILTSVSLFLTFRVGVDGVRFNAMGPFARSFMMIMPVIVFLPSMNFASALTYYWFCTNTIAIFQALAFRTPALRAALGIPKMREVKKEEAAKTSFRESVRESIENFQSSVKVIDMRAADAKAFESAGFEKKQRTYKYDPTKPVVINHKKKNLSEKASKF